jgi:hypothetical protein
VCGNDGSHVTTLWPLDSLSPAHVRDTGLSPVSDAWNIEFKNKRDEIVDHTPSPSRSEQGADDPFLSHALLNGKTWATDRVSNDDVTRLLLRVNNPQMQLLELLGVGR